MLADRINQKFAVAVVATTATFIAVLDTTSSVASRTYVTTLDEQTLE